MNNVVNVVAALAVVGCSSGALAEGASEKMESAVGWGSATMLGLGVVVLLLCLFRNNKNRRDINMACGVLSLVLMGVSVACVVESSKDVENSSEDPSNDVVLNLTAGVCGVVLAGSCLVGCVNTNQNTSQRRSPTRK